VLAVVVTRSSSVDRATCYVLPVSWMTSCLPVIDEAKAARVGRILRVVHHGGSIGAKSDVYYCLARLDSVGKKEESNVTLVSRDIL